MKRLQRWAWAVLAALLLPGAAWATNYTFPGSLPAGCSGSGGNYACSALTLAYGDSITIASAATITVNGNLTTNTNNINSSGSAANLTLVVSGTLALTYHTTIVANISAGAVTDSGQASITGSIATTTGALTLGYATPVSGSLSSTSGAITVGQSATIGGSITSTSGNIGIGYGATVNGAVASGGTITLAQSGVVNGTITGTTQAVSIGYGATVSGAVTTSSGTITLGQSADVNACVKSTASAAITLGYQSSTGGVCCGSGSCATSCVVNNTGSAMPSTCASTPTLTSGTRYSFESYDTPGYYIRHYGFLGYINPVSASSDALTRSDSTYIARPGLANASCWSFESVNYPGYYLRHNNYVIKLNAYSATAPYPADATFCLRSGLANASAISFEASNYAGYYIQHKTDNSLILATTDGSAAVNGRSTFQPRTGWAATVEHYELSAPSIGLACQASTLTVTACADSSSPCTNPVTSLAGQTATLATSAGTLGSGTVTFDASGSTTTTLSYAAASAGSTATVTLSGESTSATSARRCCADGTSCSAANSCSTTFNTAGFIIAASAGGSATTLPTQTAGTPSGSYVLRAVKTNTTTKACEAALSGSTTVNWGVQCNDPATCSSGNRMTLTASSAVAVAGNANGSSAASTAVPMSFDANGNASFSFSYADVGKVTLLASKAAGGSLQSGLSGSSNSFVVKPAGFVLSAIRCASYAAGSCATAAIASPGNNPGASSASGSAFMPAGKPFSATVTAVDASGNTTPNYGRETTPEGVTLTATLVQPAAGNAPGLSNPSAFGSFSNGVATGSTFAWPEVGIVTLTPAVADGSYLGAGNVTGTTSGNVGRFVPASFALSAAAATHRSNAACAPASTFTYLGETFSLGFTLTARNAAGTTTQNYVGSFAKLDPTAAAGWNLAGIGGTTTFSAASGRLALGSASGAWSGGTAAVTLNAAATRAAAPDGPFNAAFGIAPVDSDGTAMAAYDLASSSGGSNDRTTVATLPLRFGRLRVSNAIGAADRALALPVAAQYWNGSAWAANTLDSCTRVPTTALNFGNLRRTLTAADTTASAAIGISAGLGSLRLAAPGGGRSGTFDVALSLGSSAADASCLQPWTPASGDAATAGANLAYLRGAWCGAAYANDPSARASFGLQRTQDQLIYRRENY